MSEPAVPYKEGLRAALADPQEAAAYLNAALEEGDEAAFLLALRDVAEAHKMDTLPQLAEMDREGLSRLLSPGTEPQWSRLNTLLKAIGLRLVVEPEPV
jgi:probable addiction module antidote protein